VGDFFLHLVPKDSFLSPGNLSLHFPEKDNEIAIFLCLRKKIYYIADFFSHETSNGTNLKTNTFQFT
jgi:hypothetical protein